MKIFTVMIHIQSDFQEIIDPEQIGFHVVVSETEEEAEAITLVIHLVIGNQILPCQRRIL